MTPALLPPPTAAAVPYSSARRTDADTTTNTGPWGTDSCAGTNTRARRTGTRYGPNAWRHRRPRNDNSCAWNNGRAWNNRGAWNNRRAWNTDAGTRHHTGSRRSHTRTAGHANTRRTDSGARPHASTRRTGSRTAARLTGFGSGTDDRTDKGHGDGKILWHGLSLFIHDSCEWERYPAFLLMISRFSRLRLPRVTARRSRPATAEAPVALHRDIFQATDRRTARDRYPQPLTAFHATVRAAREKSGFKAGLRRHEKSGLERG